MLGLPDGITAYLFDLDGVLTKTAAVHAAAWKEAFDEVLTAHAGEPGVDSTPFDKDGDYLKYVDGKPRYDGVRDFLAARGIHPPDGAEGDPPNGPETVRSIGDHKNEAVKRIIVTDGVEVFPGSLRFLHAAKDAGIKIACVSSSANAEAVLKAASIDSFIDVRMDGAVAAAEGIKGKPAPDMFLKAAERLGETIATSAVFEDAISGVHSGAAGKFKVVIGVNRGDASQRAALTEAGATLVVDDLSELLDAPTPA